MNRTHVCRSYRQIATQTAHPGQLVLMLYDGAIRFLERARLGFGAEEPLEFNREISNNVLRAQAILNELNSSLNMDAGGEVSANLRRLYDYLYRRLQESNSRKDETGIREVIRRLTVLRDAWAEMLQKQGTLASPVGGRSLAAPV